MLNKPMETQSYEEQGFGLISPCLKPPKTPEFLSQRKPQQSNPGCPGKGDALQEDVEPPKYLRHHFPEQTELQCRALEPLTPRLVKESVIPVPSHIKSEAISVI